MGRYAFNAILETTVQMHYLLRYILLIVLLAAAPAAHANPIAQENAQQGTDDWEIPDADVSLDHQIEGYASAASVNKGGTIDFHVSSNIAPAQPYSIQIFRLGWYGGLGGRALTAHPEEKTATNYYVPTDPPNASTCPQTGSANLVQCSWPVSHTLTIPTTWTSGFYVAKLSVTTVGKHAYIPFVVRDDAQSAAYLYPFAVNTYQAYNKWGGVSFYTNPSAKTVSFDRPYLHCDKEKEECSTGVRYQNKGASLFFDWDYPMVRWLERNGYDVTYATSVDVHRDSALLLRPALLLVGHDEYWTGEMRANVENARALGVNIGSFSGNTVWGHVFLDSTHRRMDSDNTFRALGNPEEALLGVMTVATSQSESNIIAQNTSHWIYRNSGLRDGDLIVGILGYEAEGICKTEAVQGRVVLSHTPITIDRNLVSLEGPCSDNGVLDDRGHHNMVFFTASSGAAVFSAGTIKWSWGLDDFNYSGRAPVASAPPQSITSNVLTRLAVPPLASSSRPASASWGQGRIDLFARGQSGSLFTKWYQDGVGWSRWTTIGSGIGSGLGASSWGPGRLDVFAVSTSGQLQHRWYSGGVWNGPFSLSASAADSPASVSWASGRIDVFYRRPDGSIGTVWYDQIDGLGWHSEYNLGSPPGTLVVGSPAVSSFAPQRLDVFVRATDGQLWHRWYAGVSWSSWEALGGQLASSPAAVSWGWQRIDVFYRGSDGGLRTTWYDASGGGWHINQSLGGLIEGDPAATAWAPGRLDLFSIDTNNTVRHGWYAQGAWRGPDWQ